MNQFINENGRRRDPARFSGLDWVVGDKAEVGKDRRPRGPACCPPPRAPWSAAPHRVPAVQALVAGAAADGDAAADVAGGGVGLEFAALLAEGVGDDGQPQRRAAGGGAADFGGLDVGAVGGSQFLVGGVAVGEGLGRVGLDAGAVAVAVPSCWWRGRGRWSGGSSEPEVAASAIARRVLRRRRRGCRRTASGACGGAFFSALGGVGGAVAGDELHRQPAEDVVDQALGDRDFGVAGHAAGFEADVLELADERFDRHAVLQADARRAWRWCPSGRRWCEPSLAMRDEDFAGLAVFVQADGDVALVAGDVELVRDRRGACRAGGGAAGARRCARRSSRSMWTWAGARLSEAIAELLIAEC